MHELASSNLIWRNEVMVGYFVFNTFDVQYVCFLIWKDIDCCDVVRGNKSLVSRVAPI